MALFYDLNKIKFATDEATFQRGMDLYERGKVGDVEQAVDDYSAVVKGTQSYRVSISGKCYQDATCECYLGQREILCKHVVALALKVVSDGQPLKSEDKQQTHEIKCSDRREELSKDQLAEVKSSIADAMKYIKAYHGPSKTWFANQESLQEGCSRLRAIVSDLPVNRQTADILVKLLLRLEKKLTVGGVDDSNGIVWPLMSEIVQLLIEYARRDSDCVKSFKPLLRLGNTSFGWEKPLVNLVEG